MRFKKLIILFFLYSSIYFYQACAAEIDTSIWQTKSSHHFTVYYQDAPAGFVDDLIYKAEKYYNSIVDGLGFRRFEFWSWENRAKIYLYKEASGYQKEANHASWSGAMVNVKKRTIKTFLGQPGFFDSILPHEMTHIIFREFIGPNASLPLWLDEGVAASQEESNLIERLKKAASLVRENEYIDINRLSLTRDFSLIDPQIFYSESASLIVFLLQQYGRDKFLDFSRSLRDGEGWQEALLSNYRFKDFEEMQGKWMEFMTNWGQANG